jgi:uncharacterized protein (DUF305 family)
MKRTHLITAAALAGLVAACSSPDEASNMSANTVAAPAEGMNSTTANAQMGTDPTNPYASAEMQMRDRMMAAVGVDASDTWVKKMIEHHRGAVDMTDALLGQASSGPIVEMARKTKDKQQKEIAELEKMRREGNPVQQSAEVFRPSMMKMHEVMMAAKGSDAAETWARKMIEHHRGAVEMSNIVLRNGATGKVREMAQKTIREQNKDIEDLQKLLRGETPAAAKAEPITAPKDSAAQAAPKATPSPRATAEKSAANVDEHAGHNMAEK